MRKIQIDEAPRRTRLVQFRLTPDEYEIFNRVCEENKVTKANMLRWALKKLNLKVDLISWTKK